MSIYFDRTLPMYLSDKPTFNGIKVDVDASSLEVVEALRLLIELTESAITEAAAPERSNQELAEKFVAGLKEITNGAE